METYHKIQTLFKRDLDGSRTGQKGKMIEGAWTTPELEYLADKEWEFTEKVDGTNIRIRLHRYQDWLYVDFAGRSDNAAIPGPLMRYLEETFPATKSKRETTHRESLIGLWMLENNLNDLILFGEGYGPKIQGGGKYRDDHSFVLFDVKIGDFWLTRDNVDDIAKNLQIDSVPTLGYGTLYDGIDIVKNGLESKWATVSAYHEPFEAEGIVARPKVPLFNRKSERIITKIKAVDFR